MKKKKEHHRQEIHETIAGVLTPAGWDENGCITEVMLSAIDDEEYLVENGEKFIELIQHNVVATGVVKRERKSFRTINIKKIILTAPAVPEKTEDGWLLESRGGEMAPATGHRG